jgi:hypothetical protein
LRRYTAWEEPEINPRRAAILARRWHGRDGERAAEAAPVVAAHASALEAGRVIRVFAKASQRRFYAVAGGQRSPPMCSPRPDGGEDSLGMIDIFLDVRRVQQRVYNRLRFGN